MTWPTIFANLAAGNQPLSLFDAMFNQVAQMVAIPSTATGTNAITLQPIGSAPALTAYQNFSTFRFIAGATTTGLVTAQYQALGFLPVYLSDGVTQASTGSVVINLEWVLVFAQFLNGGSGGFFLEAASVPAIPAVAGSAFTNLVITNNAGTPNTQINVTYDELVMNNLTGGALRATGQSFTINAATAGVVNGLDSGALANTTWYAVYGISNGATNGGLLSTSFTTPAMPAGYTFRKRIGTMRTDGAANFLRTIQNGRDAQQQLQASGNTTTTRLIASGAAGTYSTTSPTLVTVSIATFVPPSATTIKLNWVTSLAAALNSNVLIAPNVNWGGTNQGPQGTNSNIWPIWAPGAGAGIVIGAGAAELVLEGTTIAWCSSAAGGGVALIGWRDNI